MDHLKRPTRLVGGSRTIAQAHKQTRYPIKHFPEAPAAGRALQSAAAETRPDGSPSGLFTTTRTKGDPHAQAHCRLQRRPQGTESVDLLRHLQQPARQPAVLERLLGDGVKRFFGIQPIAHHSIAGTEAQVHAALGTPIERSAAICRREILAGKLNDRPHNAPARRAASQDFSPWLIKAWAACSSPITQNIDQNR